MHARRVGAAWAALLLFAAPAAAELTLNGTLASEHRASMHEPYPWTWHRTRLAVRAEASPSMRTRFYGELHALGRGYPAVGDAGDLADRDAVAPLDVRLQEAYADVYDLIVPGLELRFGRQRIAWGRGDKVNPTDNLNPDDLEDIWDYGAHLGSDGVKLTYGAAGVLVTAVFLPYFTPAVLPAGDLAAVFAAELDLPPGLTPGTISETVHTPAQTLQDAPTLAAKVSGRLAGFDLSASFVHHRDDFPVLRRVVLTPGPAGALHAEAELMYPREHVAGFDLAGDLGGLGVWAEVAVFFPETVPLGYDVDPALLPRFAATGVSLPEPEALDGAPYVKWLVGFDYTFPFDVYVNAQFLHGFVHERGADLGDYVLMNLDWTVLEGILQITPVGIGLEVRDWNAPENTYSFIAMPQLTYWPADNVEILIGGRWIWGTPGATFGPLTGADETFVRLSYSF